MIPEQKIPEDAMASAATDTSAFDQNAIAIELGQMGTQRGYEIYELLEQKAAMLTRRFSEDSAPVLGDSLWRAVLDLTCSHGSPDVLWAFLTLVDGMQKKGKCRFSGGDVIKLARQSTVIFRGKWGRLCRDIIGRLEEENTDLPSARIGIYIPILENYFRTETGPQEPEVRKLYAGWIRDEAARNPGCLQYAHIRDIVPKILREPVSAVREILLDIVGIYAKTVARNETRDAEGQVPENSSPDWKSSCGMVDTAVFFCLKLVDPWVSSAPWEALFPVEAPQATRRVEILQVLAKEAPGIFFGKHVTKLVHDMRYLSYDDEEAFYMHDDDKFFFGILAALARHNVRLVLDSIPPEESVFLIDRAVEKSTDPVSGSAACALVSAILEQAPERISDQNIRTLRQACERATDETRENLEKVLEAMPEHLAKASADLGPQGALRA
ncbi:MAG: hypothetical protein M3O22_02595 [Pseudomonadota bacterium]|nr:hypothetical protein [Pseudomonadota bacterium]